VQLQALGSTEVVYWLLDGRLVGTTQGGPARQSRPARDKAVVDAAELTSGTALRLTLREAGQHALTAMDASGQYQQVLFSVR
jgi:membrane carboxypeptidase/penicillin-binding protein PbpC